jgi:hypothetical protein
MNCLHLRLHQTATQMKTTIVSYFFPKTISIYIPKSNHPLEKSPAFVARLLLYVASALPQEDSQQKALIVPLAWLAGRFAIFSHQSTIPVKQSQQSVKFNFVPTENSVLHSIITSVLCTHIPQLRVLSPRRLLQLRIDDAMF